MPETPEIALREVDADNVVALCRLELAPGQESYVAPSAQTIAQAQFEPNAWMRGVYAGEEAVGLVYLELESPPKLVRLMIDAAHQGRGYGRRTVELVVEHLHTQPGVAELLTSYVPGPQEPRGFYTALGFRDTGRVEHDESVLSLALGS